MDIINNTNPSADLGAVSAKCEPRGFCLCWMCNRVCDPGYDPDWRLYEHMVMMYDLDVLERGNLASAVNK